MNILVTGGAGYIGSHTCVELLKSGYEVFIVDSLVNSNKEVINRIEKLANKKVVFYEGDIRDKNLLNKIFSLNKIDSVIHFAGLKAVGESVLKPLEYYSNNITGTLSLLESMREHNVKNMVFSSSATVYGSPESVPIKETFPLSATNPYGRTKLMLEEILGDIYNSDNSWNITLLRYFNPVGAHESGMIGEDPKGIPNNLVPYITQVIFGKLDYVKVFGDDYETKDGTGIRDYIHVVDLSVGHIKALEQIKNNSGFNIYNLGTGIGYSVFEIIKSFENTCKKKIPYKVTERRKGDIAICYADPSKAYKELGFKTTRHLSEMCEDSLRWQKNNPNGYICRAEK